MRGFPAFRQGVAVTVGVVADVRGPPFMGSGECKFEIQELINRFLKADGHSCLCCNVFSVGKPSAFKRRSLYLQSARLFAAFS